MSADGRPGPLTTRSGRPQQEAAAAGERDGYVVPRRAGQPALGLKPLRRRPKQLDAEPTLLHANLGAPANPANPANPGGPGGLVLGAGGPGVAPGGGSGSGAPGITGEAARLLAEAPADGGLDPETVRRARQIAARLSVPRPRRDVLARRGAGELASVRYRGGSDDIDLDATLENLVERPVPEDDDIVVRERLRTRRSVVLAVDVSGSMRGERVRTAAATVGALAAELSRDDLAVIAFWSDAAVLARLGQRVPAPVLLDALLRTPARGLTNISFPLQAARRLLAAIPARDARVLLLSDCVHNAGPDPRLAAAGLARLDVLLDTSGEHGLDLARDLARLGRGRLAVIRGYRDVAPAASALFAR